MQFLKRTSFYTTDLNENCKCSDTFSLLHVHTNTGSFHRLADRANADESITLCTQTQVPTRQNQNLHVSVVAAFASWRMVLVLFIFQTAFDSLMVGAWNRVVYLTVPGSLTSLSSALFHQLLNVAFQHVHYWFVVFGSVVPWLCFHGYLLYLFS